MSARGLTLVELLITTALMALTAGVTVSALAGGVRIWRRANEIGAERQLALVALAQVQRDLRNARRFAPVPFSGRAREASFASVDASATAEVAELGRLGYYVDGRTKQLCRSFVPFRIAHRVRLQGRCRAVLEDVQAVQFAYLAPSAGSWAESWDEPELPAAVRVTVRMADGAAGSHSIVVPVPVAALPAPSHAP